MSLFRLKDLWSAYCGFRGGQDEETIEGQVNGKDDSWNLKVADLEGLGRHLLVVGGHDGHLRIFDPHSDWDKCPEQPLPQFKPTDLLIETQLPQPILQVAVGKLVSGSKNDHIGVLHPRSIAVYSLITVTGSAEHGDQSQLYLAYEHQLKRCAYNMIVGGFGGVVGRDFLCIQSLDGALMFFEQETLALTRTLPNFLLPSPIAYVPHTDSFVILNSEWFLESYRYQVLGEESTKKLTPSWSYNLGESMTDIHCVSVTTNRAAIVVVAQSSLLCFRETGVLEFAKRLPFNPVISLVYVLRDSTNVMTLIVSELNHLLVYEHTTLKWTAQLHKFPIALARANLKAVEGCLAIIYDDGHIECSYLGTEPQTFVPPPLVLSQQAGIAALTMSQMESKLSTLQHEITLFTQFNSKNPLEGSSGSVRTEIKLALKCWLLDSASVVGSSGTGEGGSDACRVEISATPVVPVENCTISLHLRPPFIASPASHFRHHLGQTEEFYSNVTFEQPGGNSWCPWDNELKAVASYLGSSGGGASLSGVVTATVHLPLPFILQPAPPIKDSPIKLTFSVTHTYVLPTLFPEFGAKMWDSNGCSETLAGFRFRAAPDFGFTVALSRQYSKYRLETDNVVALALPTVTLAKKLGGKRLETHQHFVALKELLEQADRNVTIRNRIRDLQVELKEATSQYRAGQRRLLSKLRDKIATEVDQLEKLMSWTYDLIMEYTHQIEQAQEEMMECGNVLANLVKLTTTLFRLSPTTCKEAVEDLTHALSSTDHHYTEVQGWAEATEFALTHLLRTSLARNIQDEQRVLDRDHISRHPVKLKNLIALAFDRVTEKQNRVVSPIMEGEEHDSTRHKRESSKVAAISVVD